MTTDREIVLQAQAVQRRYVQGGRELPVLQGVDLSLASGETLAILGVSGSGKTTLLNLLGGLDDVDGGSIAVSGRDWQPMNSTQRASWRNRHVGFVYQFHHLLGEFSALENVALPMMIGKASVAEARQRATELLQQVGLGERLDHRPAMLSGGERQRVAIARALVTRPSLVLMDEPTGNLDPHTAEVILELLLDLNRQLGICFVVVTHDTSIAARMDRTLRLLDGRLVTVEMSAESAIV